MLGLFIWCWNDETWLPDCLTSLRETTSDIFFVGILNASTDSSIDLLCEYCDEVIIYDTPQSVSKCVNTGYEIIYDYGCDYLGWIHPDQKFHQGSWLDVLRDTLDKHPEIGKISAHNIKNPVIPDYIYAGAEAGNLIRRSAWEEIGPYDERYIGCGGYEDWDIQRRFIAKGYGNYVTPQALTWHSHGGTRLKIDHNERHKQWAHNQEVYYSKWNTYDNAMVPVGCPNIPLTG